MSKVYVGKGLDKTKIDLYIRIIRANNCEGVENCKHGCLFIGWIYEYSRRENIDKDEKDVD